MELLQKKFDMLNVLNDIEIAVSMQKADASKKARKLAAAPGRRELREAQRRRSSASIRSRRSTTFIQTYIDDTARAGRKPKLIDLFRLDRKGEGERFKEHDDIDNRKLLWHGTNVAVVAAICKTGLRIMPHSGGRVGKGIYLASENGKSINYMGWASGGTRRDVPRRGRARQGALASRRTTRRSRQRRRASTRSSRAARRSRTRSDDIDLEVRRQEGHHSAGQADHAEAVREVELRPERIPRLPGEPGPPPLRPAR